MSGRRLIQAGTLELISDLPAAGPTYDRTYVSSYNTTPTFPNPMTFTADGEWVETPKTFASGADTVALLPNIPLTFTKTRLFSQASLPNGSLADATVVYNEDLGRITVTGAGCYIAELKVRFGWGDTVSSGSLRFVLNANGALNEEAGEYQGGPNSNQVVTVTKPFIAGEDPVLITAGVGNLWTSETLEVFRISITICKFI